MPLDTTDLAILSELQRDGSLTNVELARRVHLSPSPCLARVRALERSGAIRRYVALVDPEAIGLGVSVFISISLREQNTATLAEFERQIGALEEVMECYLMTGDADYLLKVVLRGGTSFEAVHRDVLTTLPGVSRLVSHFSIRPIKASG